MIRSGTMSLLPRLPMACALVSALIPTLMLAQIDRTKAPVPGPPPQVNVAGSKNSVLPNGMRVIVVENHKLPVVSVQVRFDHPPIKQGGIAGYQDLVGELLTAGTERRSKESLDEAVDSLGAQLNGASDGLVVELTPAKALVKVRQFGDIGYQAIRSIALDPSGNAYVVGTFNGTIDFGKGVMTGPPASGSFSQPHSVFVAKLNPSLDGVVQKNGGATAGGDYLTEAAVDPFGNVAIGGMVQSSIKLGANTVTAFTGGDLYFAYLDGSLSEIWSGGYGGYAGQTLSGFAARPGGSLVAAGFTNGTLSFGLGGLPVGTAGYFLVQFDTAGNPISNFGASVNGGSVSPQVMTYLGGTDYLFAGTCQGGTLVLPSGSRNCTNKAFVTRFAP